MNLLSIGQLVSDGFLEVVGLDTIPWPKDKQPPRGTLISSILSLPIAHPTLASGVTRNQ